MKTRLAVALALVLLLVVPGCGGLVAFEDRDPGLPRRDSDSGAVDAHGDDCPEATPAAFPDVVVLCQGMPDGMRCCATYGEDAAISYAVRVECEAGEIWVR